MILACCDLDQLHPNEEKAISTAVEKLNDATSFISNVAEESDSEHFSLAHDYVNKFRNQVFAEFESLKSGETLPQALCMSPHLALAGRASDESKEIGAVRILILQGECMTAGCQNNQLR